MRATETHFFLRIHQASIGLNHDTLRPANVRAAHGHRGVGGPQITDFVRIPVISIPHLSPREL